MTIPASTPAAPPPAAGTPRLFDRLAAWFADAVQHAIGSLHDQEAMAPPPIGVQPYRDRPSKLR
jgi:hypothetical protein